MKRPFEPWEQSRSRRDKFREARESAAARDAEDSSYDHSNDPMMDAGDVTEEEFARAARLRQRAREEEEEALLATLAEEEARRERAERRAAKSIADGARLQLAHERWIESDAGRSSAELRASLPIAKLVEPLRDAMGEHQVGVLCGETGSGKSTQVPQMLLETALASGKGGDTFILCTQPRRIAATSLARRVATERGEAVGTRGSLVGYQVRMTYICPTFSSLSTKSALLSWACILMSASRAG